MQRPGGSSAVALCALLLFARPGAADLNEPPPVAARIVVGTPDSAGEAVIRGADGAVSAKATVIFVNLQTGHYAAAAAASDGSFDAVRLYAPSGSWILVKADPTGAPFQAMAPFSLIRMAGTILHVPDPPATDGGVGFGGAGLTQGANPLPWRFAGSLSYQQGQQVVLRGTVTIDSPAVDLGGPIALRPQMILERFTVDDGSPSLAQATFASTLLTPTGLPVERVPGVFAIVGAPVVTLTRTASGRAEASVELRMTPPSFAGPGFYRPALLLSFDGVPPETPPARPMLFDLKAVDRASRTPGRTIGAAGLYAPLIRIGEPAAPNMSWMLLVNESSEGTRGARAIEDRARFNFAPRVVTESDLLIVPRRDVRTGKPVRYRLEPFAPGVSVGDRELPSPPSVPFRFPSGSFTAELTRPDGTKVTLGPLPFVQSRSINRVLKNGAPLDAGGGFPHDPYQLTTLDERFEVTFDVDGLHVVRLDGWIEDLWGNRWNASGTYEVLVARPMVLDTDVLPGTPFEVGDSFDAGLQLVPPVAADVEVRVEVPGQPAVYETRGQANAFGRLRLPGFAFHSPGEYRVDVVATWREGEGPLWAGSRTWGGVVAPRDAPLVARGRRGIDDQAPPAPTWFRRSTPTGSGHIQVPLLGGDVVWATDSDAVIPHITWGDPQRILENLFSNPRMQSQWGRYVDGEAPPLLFTASGADPHLDPQSIACWCYAYRSVQRPLVRVREIVAEESGLAGFYWRFNSAYGGQSGNGVNGDLPNDFKFQFGGVVMRGSAVGLPQCAIYGSLFVLAPETDFTFSRVFPPFRGNGGGPDGGPLLTLKGKEVDVFFHPTGVKPGTILHRGERISFAGYAAPPLPAKVEIVVTSPGGVTRTVRGRANAIGWFHDPARDFGAFESGVWKARVRVVFDGRTSAGQVTEPFPAGDVLGTREGEFYFYVVDGDVGPLQVSGAGSPFVRPADGPITFTALKPSDLTDVRLTYTTTMPGFVLEEGTKTSLTYAYDAAKLAASFPNLDLAGPDGTTGVDVIAVSLMVSGRDAEGRTRHYARQIAINGEELHAPVQQPRPKRRAVR